MIHNSLILTGQTNQNLQELPGNYAVKGNRIIGAILMIFAVVFGAEPIYVLIGTILDTRQGFQHIDLKHLALAPVGIIFLGWGLNQFYIDGTLIIDRDKVTCDYRNLLGRHYWCDKITAYSGVRKKIEKGQANVVGSRQLYYAIWLVNRKPARSIRLYRAWSNQDWDKQLQWYAKLFNRPVLP